MKMNHTEKKSNQSLAALAHISTFSKYVFPFGNLIFPLIIWATAKKDKFVEDHARQALNFQISIFLYSVFIISAAVSAILLLALDLNIEINLERDPFYFVQNASVAIPVLVTLAIAGFLLLSLFILEIVTVITATMKASENSSYKYPMSIPFIKSSNQSKNEQFNNTKNESL